MTINELKINNPQWFAKGNKAFFGDLEYRLLHGELTGDPYLCRKTNAWSDMFDGIKKPHWRINPIGDESNPFKIKGLVDETFQNLWHVKAWLKAH